MTVPQDRIPAFDMPAATPAHAKASKRLKRFARDEEGTLLIFGVYIFVLILMVGGIGIDLMRFERDRSELQYTLDRAVLAAADLDQQFEPTAVVQDYFDKAQLGGYLNSVSVSEGLGYRSVTAQAKTEVRTQFMHMTGLDVMTAPASGTAEERIDSVEISLVLDVSGSMNSNSRLTNLKVAAKEFVDTMVDNTEDGKMSMSIIPYATQVSLPDGIMDRLNVSRPQTYSNCVNFTANDFNNTAVSPDQTLQGTMHFDPWNTSDRRDNGTTVSSPVCEEWSSREVLLMQKNKNTLKSFINSLSARGNTSIDIGMKWGTALLDPAFRPIVNGMIGDGDIPGDFAARPLGYDEDVLKVVVLMTDGQNTSQYYINENFREGDSPIWWNSNTERYSVYYSGYQAWYWPHNNRWADHPYGDDGWGCVGYSPSNWSCGNRNESGSAERLSYGELWARTPLQANVRMNYEPWMNDNAAWNQWFYDVREYANTSAKNNRAYDICDAAKDQDIIVFTIGFEAPYSGREVLRRCASSDSHYYDVRGLEISDAFASIATSIRKLRLTQ